MVELERNGVLRAQQAYLMDLRGRSFALSGKAECHCATLLYVAESVDDFRRMHAKG